jgi:hypothetical protein
MLTKGGRAVIEVSPHIESSHQNGMETSPVRRSRKKDSLGVFAKILSGLLGKTGSKNIPDGVSKPDGKTGEALLFQPERVKKPPRGGDAVSNLVETVDGAAGTNGPREKSGTAKKGKQLFPENIVYFDQSDQKKSAGTSATVTGTGEGQFHLMPPEHGLNRKPLTDGIPQEAVQGETSPSFRSPRGKDVSKSRNTAGEDQLAVKAPETVLSHLSNLKKQDQTDSEIRGKPAGKERRREKISVEVEDFRSVQSEGGNIQLKPVGEAPVGRETDMTVELRPGRVNPETGDRAKSSGETGSFETLLARELKQDLSGDIVRQAHLVLRDGGEGTIRLALRPESLGNVKIRLEMAENKITGHIVVESEEALRAFEKEVHSLEQAFLDSGFDGAELDFSMAGGKSGQDGQRKGEEASPFFAKIRFPEAASRYAMEHGTVSGEFSGGISRQNGRVTVNMLI